MILLDVRMYLTIHFILSYEVPVERKVQKRFRRKRNNVEIFCCANKKLIARSQLSPTPRVVSPERVIACIVLKTQN